MESNLRGRLKAIGDLNVHQLAPKRRTEIAYGEAYQALVLAGYRPQLKRKYRA